MHTHTHEHTRAEMHVILRTPESPVRGESSTGEARGALGPHVSDQWDGTRVTALVGRRLYCSESSQGEGWGQGGAHEAGEHRDCMGRHPGHWSSRVLSRVGPDHCPYDLELWLCSSRHPCGGTHGEEGPLGKGSGERPGARPWALRGHSAQPQRNTCGHGGCFVRRLSSRPAGGEARAAEPCAAGLHTHASPPHRWWVQPGQLWGLREAAVTLGP